MTDARWPYAACVVAAGVAAVGAARADALVAVGAERLLPVAIAAVVALTGTLWARRFATRPSLATAPALLPGLLGLAWGASATLPSSTVRAPPGPDVVLITLDTFRADHVGVIGGGSLTPHIDALAAQGVVWRRAYTSAPLTGPAHASLLTGLDAPEHGLVANGAPLVHETIVRRIARKRATGAFLASRVLDRTSGLTSGFSHYDDRFSWWARLGAGAGPAERSGDQVVARATAWLESEPGAAFAWVHLYDPHTPYAPPREFAPTVSDLATARAADRADRAASQSPLDEAEGAHVHEGRLMYAAEIRATDAWVGRLLAAVPDAIVVLVADHGEALDEHGYWFDHGALLHDAALHVPLIVRWPGVASPAVRDDLVATSRVAATLLDASGVEARPESLRFGVPSPSVASFTPGQQSRRPLASGPWRQQPGERRASASLRFDSGKLVSHQGAPASWFDLATDPGELEPLPPPPELASTAEEVRGIALGTTVPAADALRALGYVD